MNVKEIIKELDEAIDLVSMIKVSHEAVDVMATAKQKIRIAMAALNEVEKTKETQKAKEAADNG